MVIKYPTTPNYPVRLYTTMWNINCQKAVQTEQMHTKSCLMK